MLGNESKLGKIMENTSPLPLKKFNIFTIKRIHTQPGNNYQLTNRRKNQETARKKT